MIDFRYHLVSIISIFLALAVGIVLGAGPLKGSIGDTLTTELANVRKDKAALNDELTAARRLQASSNAFAGTVLGPLVDRRLLGAKVAVVLGPQANSAAQKGISDAVARAGGQVVTTVTLTGDALDPDKTATRTTTLKDLAAGLGATATDDADLFGVVLGRSIATGAPGGGSFAPVKAAEAMSALIEAGLVRRPSAQPGADGAPVPTLVVLLPGPVSTTSAAVTTAQTSSYLGLARGLDAVSVGAVLTSAQGTATNDGSAATVVSAARASSSTADVVTTVDDLDLPMGEAALVLALANEPASVPGRYGVLADAQAVVPTISTPTAPRTSPTPASSR